MIPLCILGEQGFCASILADQSQSPSQPWVPFSASYYRIGVGLAGEYMNSDARLKVMPVDERALGQIGSAQSQVAKRLQVALCGELGVTLTNHYYLGLLVSWRHSGAQNLSSVPIRGARFFSHEFRINHYTDVMIKPGYQLTPRFMLYGLVGPSIANWRHTTSQLNATQGVVDTFKMDKVSLGAGLGLGCEYLFKKHYAVSVDYTYHFFGSSSKSQMISYLDTTGARPPVIPPRLRTGILLKKVQPSFGTIAVRFTMFFRL